MIKNNSLGRTLLLALALVVFLAASGNAQQTKQAPKVSKAAKTQSKEPRRPSSWGSNPRPSTF